MSGTGVIIGNGFGLIGYILMMKGFVKSSLFVLVIGAVAIYFVESLT